MKVVLDTNVFIYSFSNHQGNPKKIIDLWKSDKITLCLTYEILWEYLEVLLRLAMAGQSEIEELLILKNRLQYQI